MRYFPDNIVAVATAPQNGAIGIVRISGVEAKNLLTHVFVSQSGLAVSLVPGRLHFGRLVGVDGVVLDHCLAVYMPGPHTFTGEDVVELHCHGNLLLLKKVVAAVLSLPSKAGIRGAEPGEFTKRAYLNGKVDLTQAEAVHELITASSDAALNSSLANLDGALKQLIDHMRDQLVTVLADVEASFEFSEEDIQTYNPAQTLVLVEACAQKLKTLEAAYRTSKLYDHGVSVVLVGRPNVGKSSLLNAILVEDRAIVTEVPGTTRDVVEGAKIIDGVRFIFRDTAGLRPAQDPIEKTGIDKTNEWIQKSDVVIVVLDHFNQEPDGEPDIMLPQKTTVIRVLNKADVLEYKQKKLEQLSDSEREELQRLGGYDLVVSAKSGYQIPHIETLLKKWLEHHCDKTNCLHINERQVRSISQALAKLDLCQPLLQEGGLREELLAACLRDVIGCLNDIVGIVTSEDVLANIFGRFCIGK
ncbi:MAG TPA: tRNA uridine-5-carboxymethylaminomethyl(34) synthesis GTPase MnmE [bacterium]|nr:tRNA uridine-5-carboxymethylaminomethyl(34) synthesis GTPase MnmE [bacterium]